MSTYRERASHAWTEDSIRLIATPSSFAKSALMYVQEVGHFRTLSPYFTEREHLNSFLIVYTLSGLGNLTYKGNVYELRPRQTFLIDCMEYQHYATAADPDQPWELLWVHFNGESVAPYYSAFETAGTPVVTLSVDSEASSMLRELIVLQQERTVRSELIGNRLIIGLLTEVLLAAPELSISVADAPEYVRNSIREIERHYREKITLNRLAGLSSVNKFHLAKEFKRFTGFSPNEFLINVRMSHAKERLKYSDLPIAAIAAEVGIDNVSHFIRLFKDRIDATPLSFRKRWQRPR
ncbi:helix-turn-helix transcriptional regulator [Cohnella silvisoli]|uniref:AraC family transcriptional regulator n=1 Tax=Cohnella silvisoli TaxID=2873699 RepID=A0ABV1KY17_9BACL|nr:AraC family transcriptional regulator [Cohnella silvisoli]MCD9023898.1 AraC family transcriptional regulator [Cohnella silvisoli]